MTTAQVYAMRLGLIVSLVAGPLLLPVTSGAVPAQSLSILVSATTGMFTFHATPIGSAIFMDAFLSVEVGLVVEGPNCVGHCDLYIGAILPDGRFVSWVGDSQAPTLVTSAAPVRFLTIVVPAQTTAFRLEHSFTAVDPQGWYILYGVIVDPGADPLDPHTWIDASFWPLLVTPPATQ